MKVQLTNTDRRRHDVILDKPALRTRQHGARRITVHEVTHDRRTGEQRRRAVTKAVPGVLSLRSGETSKPLHPQVLAIPRVARLVTEGTFKVQKLAAKATAEKPTSSGYAAGVAVEDEPAEKSAGKRRRVGGKE